MAVAPHREPGTSLHKAPPVSLVPWLCRVLLALSAILFALHFLHLSADFPNHSPWVDWSKYTDEGWYGDAAIRHYLSGHWYWKGDFNPAVTLPVWPALELIWFKFTGVGPQAARALTVCVFGLTLLSLYSLLRRFPGVTQPGARSFAPALCVFLMCASPFFFVFERMAILEPMLILLTTLAIHCAARLGGRTDEIRETRHEKAPLASRISHLACRWWPSVGLGILLPAMVLTKTTGLFLIPAIAYMVWAQAGYRMRRFFALGLPPAALGLALWLAYFLGFVRPHYLEDYRYLFSANAYTGILLDPFEKVVVNTLIGGGFMGLGMYCTFYVVLALAIFWRPRLFRNPLAPVLLLWAAGYILFLGYHNNLQPRYYLVVAVPVFAFVALALDSFRDAFATLENDNLASFAMMLILALLLQPSFRYLVWIVTHPTYQFEAAAQAVARTIRADKTHSPLLLSISGSDITLMTGIPSIDDDFGTMELSERARTYRPGWYAAWNELDDDKMDALTPTFHPVRVAAFPALDDPDRNLLILYRLDPGEEAEAPAKPKRRRKPTPRPLQTKVGQQPTTQQLEH